MVLRFMRLSDIDDVVTIDSLSFSSAWSRSAYQFEVGESNYSYMLVLEDAPPTPKPTLINRMLAALGNSPPRGTLLGYGGMWRIGGEAHISTIAVHPAQRGKSYGELLLLTMCARAIRMRASFVVLEVRVSNSSALNLYRKRGFEVTGVKERYYQNDGEDAYAMRLILDEAAIVRIQSDFAALVARLGVADEFTQEPPPPPRR
jgi:ribosomal-protein-alanine N-acetyltransferase